MGAASVVATLARMRQAHGHSVRHLGRVAGIYHSNWGKVERGQLGATVGTLETVAAVYDMSLEVVADHQLPFLDLDPSEAVALMRLVQYAKERHPDPPEVLVTMANKLERHTRGRL